MILHYLGVLCTGILVGFLGGMFGKGGSAIATPILSLLGVPGFVAVAAPLPATVPGTFIASVEYWRFDLLDWRIIGWSVMVGVPATIIGSLLTQFTGATPLLIVTGLMVLGFGLSFLVAPKEAAGQSAVAASASEDLPSRWRLRLVLVAAGVGLISGLLANSGGFLLAPSFAWILGQPIKKAFACSLAASMVLALPGTIVHAYLGHIDWTVTAALAVGSVPFSYLGAKVAIKTRPRTLERLYGLALTGLGAYFLLTL
ncbi:MAG: sulfite exporter TauE/SafE family protein [Bacteroidota bacterium]